MLRTILAAGLLLAAGAGPSLADPPGGGPIPTGPTHHPSMPAPDHPPSPRLVCNAGARTCPAPAHADPGERCSCAGFQGGPRLQGHVMPQPLPRH